MYQDELAHFGVKGMRWGVRKARPSSGGSGGMTRAQKKRARARVKKEAQRMKETRLADLNKKRNSTAKRAMEKAEKSIFGVGMAKVPGKLEYYHSYRIATISDGKGKDVTAHHTSHITPKKVMNRALIGAGIAAMLAAYSN